MVMELSHQYDVMISATIASTLNTWGYRLKLQKP